MIDRIMMSVAQAKEAVAGVQVSSQAFVVELEPGKFLTEYSGNWGATTNLNRAFVYSARARAAGAMRRADKATRHRLAKIIQVEVRVARADAP